MLILSRRDQEKIILPGCGVTITVVEIRSNRVRISIDAPPDVEIRRAELPADFRERTQARDLKMCVPC